jgi:hypothetical protein
MTVGAVVRREGMVVVVVFFKMERSLGAVVVWLPGMYGMVAMKSLPGRVTQVCEVVDSGGLLVRSG